MNLAFYTCFYGSDFNEAFKVPDMPSVKYNCFYYTNNKKMLEILQNTKWIPIFDDKPTRDDLVESSMAGKHVKASPHEYQEIRDYDYTCFLDSKLEKVNEKSVEDFIEKYFINANYALLLREHWFIHNNVWHEFDEGIKQERYKLQEEKRRNYINKQIEDGLTAITETHCACGLLIRNMRHDKIDEINNTWYKHIQDCGIHDQISFFFVKQLFDGFIHSFTENPFIRNVS